ncbi:MAG: hypothetical protein HC812_20040 [Leptolyngbya sp. RL_3_1]|nr:hypothetical protein [Leptolyngbya sp. RL_3_1]
MKHAALQPIHYGPLATMEPEPIKNPGGNGENGPIDPWEPDDTESCWVYRVELACPNDDGIIRDHAFVKLAPWQWGEPCIDEQLRGWVIQYLPDWLIMDARLAIRDELDRCFADEEF